jgi:hypothetical protein
MSIFNINIDDVILSIYNIFIGPISPLTVHPTHHMVDGKFIRIKNPKKTTFYGASPVTVSSPSDTASTCSSGLFSNDSSSQGRVMSEEVGIWDRLPVEDCGDFELPSKVKLHKFHIMISNH